MLGLLCAGSSAPFKAKDIARSGGSEASGYSELVSLAGGGGRVRVSVGDCHQRLQRMSYVRLPRSNLRPAAYKYDKL